MHDHSFFRYEPEIIRSAVMLNSRFPLSQAHLKNTC